MAILTKTFADACYQEESATTDIQDLPYSLPPHFLTLLEALMTCTAPADRGKRLLESHV